MTLKQPEAKPEIEPAQSEQKQRRRQTEIEPAQLVGGQYTCPLR